jgi:hypothetical protein
MSVTLRLEHLLVKSFKPGRSVCGIVEHEPLTDAPPVSWVV